MTRRIAVHLGAASAAALLVLGAGCGTARDPSEGETANTSCAACHGDRSPGVQPGDPRSAPGYDNGTDVNGRTALDSAATSIGAHAIHLSGGTLGVAVSCDQCHAVPATVDAPGHLDNQVTVTFGALATKGSPNAKYDPETQTCSNIYCHGLPAERTQPTVWPQWSQDRAAVVCGSCHGLPPAYPLHQRVDIVTQGCGKSNDPATSCHPAPYSPVSVDPKLHIDGRSCPPYCTPVSP